MQRQEIGNKGEESQSEQEEEQRAPVRWQRHCSYSAWYWRPTAISLRRSANFRLRTCFSKTSKSR